MRASLIISAAVALAGCAAHTAPEAHPAEAASLRTPHFFEDDWDGALARARAEGKPLFVDAWAPW